MPLFLQMADGPAANEGLRDRLHADGRHEPGLAIETFQCILQGQAVENGRQHAHVMSGAFLDDGAAGGELSPAQNIAAADHDGKLHAAIKHPLGLLGNIDGFVNGYAALAGRTESLPRQLQYNPVVFGFQGVDWFGVVHGASPEFEKASYVFKIIEESLSQAKPAHTFFGRVLAFFTPSTSDPCPIISQVPVTSPFSTT